jgi:hypothetical protein
MLYKRIVNRCDVVECEVVVGRPSRPDVGDVATRA